jgi:hypothetical protein
MSHLDYFVTNCRMKESRSVDSLACASTLTGRSCTAERGHTTGNVKQITNMCPFVSARNNDVQLILKCLKFRRFWPLFVRRKLTTSTHADYRLHGNGFVVQFPAGTDDYFPHSKQTGFCGPSRFPLIDTARPTTEDKRPGIETEHSSPSRADFRNEWRYNLTCLYALYRVLALKYRLWFHRTFEAGGSVGIAAIPVWREWRSTLCIIAYWSSGIAQSV